jgi:hypothetical protein
MTKIKLSTKPLKIVEVKHNFTVQTLGLPKVDVGAYVSMTLAGLAIGAVVFGAEKVAKKLFLKLQGSQAVNQFEEMINLKK